MSYILVKGNGHVPHGYFFENELASALACFADASFSRGVLDRSAAIISSCSCTARL